MSAPTACQQAATSSKWETYSPSLIQGIMSLLTPPKKDQEHKARGQISSHCLSFTSANTWHSHCLQDTADVVGIMNIKKENYLQLEQLSGRKIIESQQNDQPFNCLH